MYHILICDDEQDIVNALKIYLSSPDFKLYEANTGVQALKVMEEEDIHLILLDIMMPEMDGISAMVKIREQSNVPIILLTAKSEDTDKILGLNTGADDYITKPYTVRNVIARVKTVLRRTSGHKMAENPNRLAVDSLILDLDLKTCSVDGVEVKLTKKEFELLAFLIANKGKICSRDQILSNVWSDEVIVLDRTIDVNITRIRQKIGCYGTYIITRPGFGYGFKN